MDKESLALEWLSKYLGKAITIEEVGYESNAFDFDELDEMLIPGIHYAVFKEQDQLMTHVYVYESVMVYMIHPLKEEPPSQILIGLMDGNELVQYQLIRGDV